MVDSKAWLSGQLVGSVIAYLAYKKTGRTGRTDNDKEALSELERIVLLMAAQDEAIKVFYVAMMDSVNE